MLYVHAPHLRSGRPSNGLPFSGLGAAKPALRFYADASAATSLKQNLIGLEEVDDGVWSIYLCNVLLARLDERDFIIRG